MDSLRPLNYNIEIEPDIGKSSFRGDETVSMEVLKRTGVISLDCVGLDVVACSCFVSEKLSSAGSRVYGIENIREFHVDKKAGLLKVGLARKVEGFLKLTVSFKGALSKSLSGFYLSEYSVGGKKKRLATTQFEPADARRCFPCFDHPASKATFDITLVVDKAMTAISNMPVVREQSATGKGKKSVTFATTPKMSTYLLYLGVGKFESVKARHGNVDVRVYTTEGKKEKAAFALRSAVDFLRFYEGYFGIKYPLPKLDLVAIPDFAAGAMENWGAMTFRETELLFDPKVTTSAQKQRMAETIAHEISHQWFGDLVTMKWWDDLWLNESFATIMGVKAVAHYHPEWDVWSQFLNSDTAPAMRLDSLLSSHPIEVEVKTPAEADEIFDEISYEKGGSVLRMLESYLGERTFRDGLRSYLKKHSYGNASTKDLWLSLERSSGRRVTPMMDKWVRQEGFPLVDVRIVGERIELTQHRFTLLSGGPKNSSVWPIPLSLMAEGRVRSVMMDRKKYSLTNSKETPKFNACQTGFYRVSYPKSSIEELSSSIASKGLCNLDRFGIENDMFSLVFAGRLGISDYLDVTTHYESEDDYLVSKDILDNLAMANFFLYGTGCGEKVVSVFGKFARAQLARLGWDANKNEKHTDKILRSVSISDLGRVGDQAVLTESNRLFRAQAKDPKNHAIPADLRSTVYSNAAWSGDSKTYSELLGMYKKAMEPQEKLRLLIAMCNFKDPKLLKKTLDFSMTTNVRGQDIYVPAAVMSANPYGRKLVWPWLKRNWKVLSKRFCGGSSSILGRLIDCLGNLPDRNVSDGMRKFFSNRSKEGIAMALKQAQERIEINARFVENQTGRG